MSLQAAARIMSHSEEQLAALEEISQNFPSHARSLSRVSVTKELKKEIKKNRDYFANAMGISEQFIFHRRALDIRFFRDIYHVCFLSGPKDSMLFINGLQFDLDYVDVFSLFDTLRTESKALDGLGQLGLTDKQAQSRLFEFGAL